jgi:hypothetical protein
MPRYLPPMNDASRYLGTNFSMGDGRRNYPSISPQNSGGSTK